MPDDQATYKTQRGRILTEQELDALADEAERGYDVSKLAPRFPEITVDLASTIARHDRQGIVGRVAWKLRAAHQMAGARDFAEEARNLLLDNPAAPGSLDELVAIARRYVTVRPPLPLVGQAGAGAQLEFTGRAYHDTSGDPGA
jgi:hypothetical protein